MKLYTAYTCGNASFVTPITYKDPQCGGSLAPRQQYISSNPIFIYDILLLPECKLSHSRSEYIDVTVAPAFSNGDNKFFLSIKKFSRKNKIKRCGFIKPKGRISPSP